MREAVAILAGGGPAPGINTVISSVAKVFMRHGYRVIGIHEAFKHLFTGDTDYLEIDFDIADRIFSRGGSILQMARYKPKDTEFSADFFVKHNIKLLVTIGGDDTAGSANRLAKYLKSKNIDVKNIHVPKTIDNDLPLPKGNATFGFHSAKDTGVVIGTTIYEDARTSGNWFVVSAMGREAGHLAWGIGSACHFPMIIIPEMFNKTDITFDKIIDLTISSIIKRKIKNIPYGVSVISEGVFHFLSDEQIKSCGLVFTYDEHGHPELGNVSKAHIFNLLLQQKLKKLKISIKSRPSELGYELRCCRPIGYDLTLCTLLGMGVKVLFDQGFTGCMVTVNTHGDISPLFLKDVEDENGKIKPRLVDISSQKVQVTFRENMDYITTDDYQEAKKFVPNPEDYDFFKILNW